LQEHWPSSLGAGEPKTASKLGREPEKAKAAMESIAPTQRGRQGGREAGRQGGREAGGQPQALEVLSAALIEAGPDPSFYNFWSKSSDKECTHSRRASNVF